MLIDALEEGGPLGFFVGPLEFPFPTSGLKGSTVGSALSNFSKNESPSTLVAGILFFCSFPTSLNCVTLSNIEDIVTASDFCSCWPNGGGGTYLRSLHV